MLQLVNKGLGVWILCIVHVTSFLQPTLSCADKPSPTYPSPLQLGSNLYFHDSWSHSSLTQTRRTFITKGCYKHSFIINSSEKYVPDSYLAFKISRNYWFPEQRLPWEDGIRNDGMINGLSKSTIISCCLTNQLFHNWSAKNDCFHHHIKGTQPIIPNQVPLFS